MCAYLDTLGARFRHKEDGAASLRNYYWVGERLSPLLPRLTKHVLQGRRLKLAAFKMQSADGRNARLEHGPRGPLP